MLNKTLIDAGFVLAANVPSAAILHPTFGVINFETLSISKALNLIERGYDGISKVEKVADAKPK